MGQSSIKSRVGRRVANLARVANSRIELATLAIVANQDKLSVCARLEVRVANWPTHVELLESVFPRYGLSGTLPSQWMFFSRAGDAMDWLSDWTSLHWLTSEMLMWLQMATGFFAALTLIQWKRWLGRKFDRLPTLNVLFSPMGR